MLIKTNELLKKIEILKSVSNENDFSGLSKYFYCIDNKIYSMDGRMFIQLDFKVDYNFSIPYSEFYQIIQKIKTEEIELLYEDEKIIIKKNKTKIELLPDNKLLEKIKFEIKEDYKTLPDDFLQAIKLSRFCVNKNSTDNSGYLTIENNICYGTDKFRICSFIFKEAIPSMLLPHDCLDILIKMNVKYFQETDKLLIFKNDVNEIIGIIKNEITKLNFQKYQSIFESQNEMKIILPEEIKDNLELSDIFTDQKNLFQKEIEFIIKDKKLFCKSKNQIGSIETEINIDSDVNISFFIHPLFLIEILNICKTMEVNGDIVVFRNEQFNYFFRINRK